MKLWILLPALALFALGALAADKKIVLIAGPPSHGPGDHEHRAGCLLFQKCLNELPGVRAEVHTNGWPADAATAFRDASAVVLYSDGGGGHPFLPSDRLQTLGELMDRGVGLALIHYAVEPTQERGQKEFMDWTGGCFEQHWSVNPFWEADFKTLPKHPITRGVQPFKLRDEWYFHMRFRDGMKGVTPILTAVPPPETMKRPDGPHSGNPAVRAAVERGEPQHVAWAAQRPGGGRGFGFTGGHMHTNWGDPNFRKLVLNAILWVARAEVPKSGVQSVVTSEDLKLNLDDKGRR
jgi:type 1 glutamine amidotransferase